MNIEMVKEPAAEYSRYAHDGFEEIHRRTAAAFDEVRRWRGWQSIHAKDTTPQSLILLTREIYRSVCWYQPHTTEAGFHMIGRFPKNEVEIIRALSAHKAEEAEHGVWAREDLARLGDGTLAEESPTSFAVGAVWWRMAQFEDPLGFFGAEYLYENLTALATADILPVIERHQLPSDGMRFLVEHAIEDAKHSVFLKHWILKVLTKYPESLPSMLRCLDYFKAVWPLPVWDEALIRAQAKRRVA